MLQVLLSVTLVVLLFQGEFVTTKRNRDLFVTISLLTFGYSIFKDVPVALLTAAISYVVLSKIRIKEKFNVSSDKSKDEIANKKQEKAVYEKKNVDKSKVKPEKKQEKKIEDDSKMPEHCSQIGIREDVLKGLTKQVEEYQSNVFDKFNYDVFYHEAGSNSMDIQGIFNHEVKGYEA